MILQSKVIDIVFPLDAGEDGLVPALQSVCQQAAEAANQGYQLIILSDRSVGANNVPIPWVGQEIIGMESFAYWKANFRQWSVNILHKHMIH